MRFYSSALSAIMLIAAASSAQSLADAARQNRQQKTQTTVKAKVFTSDDLSPTPESDLAARGMLDPNQTPDQWRNSILAEKASVRYYQNMIDVLTKEQATAQYNQKQSATGPQTAQLDFLAQSLQRTQLSLGKEKEKLDILQQAARKAGMTNSVYDPSEHPHVSASNSGVLRDMHSLH